MAKLEQIIGEIDVKTLEKTKKSTPKTSVGRELINNLLYRLERRGNLMVDMEGHYIKRVKIHLSSNFFQPGEKNFTIWVKPFIRDNRYLMFNWNGVVIRASDIFGKGINSVKL